MSSFSDATAVYRQEDGSYEATVEGKWWVFRGPHGGYLTALILRALLEAVDDPTRAPRSFTTHFVSPPQEGPIEIVPTIERSGRSITYASARLMQNGRTMATSLAAFSTPWTGGMSYDYAGPPAVPLPDACTTVPRSSPLLPTFVQNFDMRWGIGPMPYSGADEATVGGWLRFADAEVVDAPAAACLLDVWAPAILPRATEPLVAPTIDITMHFRSPLPVPQADADDFYLFRLTSRLGRDGFFEEDGDLWTAEGTLIAQCRQLAIALPVR